MPRHPRFLNRLYARLFGYFWLPCPICGTYFGGHEGNWSIPYSIDLPLGTGPTSGHAVCPWCGPAVLQAREEGRGVQEMWIVVTAQGRTRFQRELHDRLVREMA